LDIGAGRGVFGKNIECEFYQGMDFSSKAIELAEYDGVNVKAIPIQEHCIEKKEFYDVIVLFQTIEHIGYDINKFLSSTIQCLKKGGRLIVSVPNNDGIIKYIANFCLNLPPHHALYWNEKSLTFLADKYNLKIETIYREPITNVKKRWWYVTMINVYINKLLFRKMRKVDVSFMSRLLRFIARVLAQCSRFLRIPKNSSDHTIIFVYRK
jgi:2-polyprenyl-3-methyl-5-hydroxy-6-metoxy-1,4-benzoquinol methylase